MFYGIVILSSAFVGFRCYRTSKISKKSSGRKRRDSSSERDVSGAAPRRPAETSPSPSPGITTPPSPVWTRPPPSHSSPCPLCLTATPLSPSSPLTRTSTLWPPWRGSKLQWQPLLPLSTRSWTCGQRASRKSPTNHWRPLTCLQPWLWTGDTDGPRQMGRSDPELRLWDTTGRHQTGACRCLLHLELTSRPQTKVQWHDPHTHPQQISESSLFLINQYLWIHFHCSTSDFYIK